MDEAAVALRDPIRDVPASFHKDMALVNSNLYTAMSVWLRKHGKAFRPKLTEDQKKQMHECFELMDQDGSGAIDSDELGAAFKLLGINMKKSDLEQLVNEVDHDGSGEVEYSEFLEIMTTTLQRLAEEAEDNAHNEGQVPFALMATAYRRKRLMEGIIQGDKEVQAQIAEITNKANAAALQEQSKKEQARQAALKLPQLSAGTNLQQRQHAALKVSKDLMDSLPSDERRALEPIYRAMAAGPTAQRSLSTSRMTAARKNADFHNSVAHKMLLQSPEVFDLRLNRSMVKLPNSMSTKSIGSNNVSPGRPQRSNTSVVSPRSYDNPLSDFAYRAPRLGGQARPFGRSGSSSLDNSKLSIAGNFI